MHEAKVAIFDDNETIRNLMRLILEIELHEVAFEAATMHESTEIIEALEEGDIDVAVVDGNLDGPIADGRDGEQIVSLLIEKRFSQLLVVGFSGSHPIPSAHINLHKVYDVPNLGRIITNWPDSHSVQNAQ